MPNFMEQLARGQQVPVPMAVHQVVTAEQKAEVEKVRGLQVRTNAAQIAGNLFSGKAPQPRDFVKICRVIELYITDGDGADDPAPSVRPAPPAG